MEFYENQFRQQYKLLRHGGLWTQCHAQDVNNNKLVSRELLNGPEEIIAWAKKYNGKANLFIGINPRTKDGTIHNVCTLSLDLDPVRPKGEAATEAQFQETVKSARLLLRELGYGHLCSSGNGALLLFPLKEPVAREVGENMGRCLIEFAKTFFKEKGITNVEVDHTFDGPRLAKVMGSISTKGDKSLWRYARIIDSHLITESRAGDFISRISNITGHLRQETIPNLEVEKGQIDRSKLDMALASRLKLQGFTAADTLAALSTVSARPERSDDHKRIVQKLYLSNGSGTREGVAEFTKPLQLWTPDNGMLGYTSRQQYSEPELSTGFKSLDRATFGLVRGSIYTVAARTNCGKTTFALNVAAHLCNLSKRCLFISTENEYKTIWDRYIATATGIATRKLQAGTLTPEDEKGLGLFMERFKQHHLSVYDGSRPNMQIVRQAVEQASPDVVIVDYFQHVEGREVRELEEFVMCLKELAKEKNIAVLITAQAHDGMVNPKTNKLYPPSLGSIKNCKVLADESQVVVLLDWDRDGAHGDGPAAVTALLAKNKGPREDCVLKLNRAVPRFEE